MIDDEKATDEDAKVYNINNASHRSLKRQEKNPTRRCSNTKVPPPIIRINKIVGMITITSPNHPR